MVSVGVFAGITFGGYSHNAEGMYETLQGDDEEGANLADLWIDNRSASWSAEETYILQCIGDIVALNHRSP